LLWYLTVQEDDDSGVGDRSWMRMSDCRGQTNFSVVSVDAANYIWIFLNFCHSPAVKFF
jgi:hypothetical protein